MDLGVRDWMIIIGLLLIAVVLLDGYRRVRNERRGKIRMSLNKQYLNSAGDDEPDTCELPNGGARVIDRSDADDRQLRLDQSVPMLMESVAHANLAGELQEEPAEAHGDLFDTQIEKASENFNQSPVSPSASSAVSADRAKTASPEDEYETAVIEREDDESFSTSAPAYQGQQEIIVLHVVAGEEPFKGPDLLHILLACDLRHGKMDIFHRYEKANGRGAVQFSVANSVEPGIFNLDDIDNFSTPGVCFFMSVPGPDEPVTAFDCMVETAQCLVKNLQGEILDESRSAMTVQTLEHYRQRLQEFERRQLAQA